MLIETFTDHALHGSRLEPSCYQWDDGLRERMRRTFIEKRNSRCDIQDAKLGTEPPAVRRRSALAVPGRSGQPCADADCANLRQRQPRAAGTEPSHGTSASCRLRLADRDSAGSCPGRPCASAVWQARCDSRRAIGSSDTGSNTGSIAPRPYKRSTPSLAFLQFMALRDAAWTTRLYLQYWSLPIKLGRPGPTYLHPPSSALCSFQPLWSLTSFVSSRLPLSLTPRPYGRPTGRPAVFRPFRPVPARVGPFGPPRPATRRPERADTSPRATPRVPTVIFARLAPENRTSRARTGAPHADRRTRGAPRATLPKVTARLPVQDPEATGPSYDAFRPGPPKES